MCAYETKNYIVKSLHTGFSHCFILINLIDNVTTKHSLNGELQVSAQISLYLLQLKMTFYAKLNKWYIKYKTPTYRYKKTKNIPMHNKVSFLKPSLIMEFCFGVASPFKR